jgi:hypothetical protein
MRFLHTLERSEMYVENMKQRDHMGDQGIVLRIILKLISVIRCGLDSTGSGKDPLAGSCEHGNKPSGFTGSKEFLDQMNVCQLPQKDPAP